MPPSSSSAYNDLKIHLCEMFQMDRGDLDFGIYRIMNMKRTEIEDFLDNRLQPEVSAILESYKSADDDEVQKELDDTIKNLKDAGVEPDTAPKVKELRQKIASIIDVDKIESEIYSDLYNFFKRYYSEGDFMSLRRYKEGVYALPYEGEEIKLHWANRDQYYIKTSEDLKHYVFKVDGGKRVRLEIAAANTEKNNNKATDDKQRRFMLVEEDAVSVDGNLLTIRFEFRADEAKRTQVQINKDMVLSLLARAECAGFDLAALAPTGNDANRTLLAKHLMIYTAKFTFDYFIHKDLDGFLKRELDFFIKNEIMHLDDIEHENAPKVETYLAKIKAMRQVAHKIIRFLAQMEDFQKNLWLKKKFVLEAHYCITLDHIIGNALESELLAEIAGNDAQREEWVRLFAIDELGGYSTLLTAEFLKANDKLQVDTRLFGLDFKYAMLSLFDDLDEATDGLLIDSENFQALNLLQERYRGQIQTIYIDPPYNTVHSAILYKNKYKHSSWLSLLNNTFPWLEYFGTEDFSLGVAIDDYEYSNLSMLLRDTFSNFDYSVVVVNHHPQGSGGRLSRTHEYYILISADTSSQYLGRPIDDYDENRNFMRSGTGENNFREYRWKSFYAILVDEKSLQVVGAEPPIPLSETYPVENNDAGFKRIYPINSRNEERVWRSSYNTGLQRALSGELIITSEGTVYQKINHQNKRETLFSNWTNSEFNAGTQGTNILDSLGLKGEFDYPKSVKTLEVGLWAQSFGSTDSIVLDYFAGSGTTGHAVINLNREDNGKRKYILVEMGEYFSTVTKPRIQKSAYSSNWKDGKPVNPDGVSQVIKCLSLEQYEDTLDNLEMGLDQEQEDWLESTPKARDDFILGYMMEMESAGSPSLLNIDYFANPFDYRLKIFHDDDYQEIAVDLIETFNYLIGLNVEKIRRFDNGIVTAEGKTLADEKTLIIWRDTSTIDSDALDDWFKTTHLQGRPWAKVIYVNGDNNLENLKSDGQQWDVRLTEEEFKRRMFDVTDV